MYSHDGPLGAVPHSGLTGDASPTLAATKGQYTCSQSEALEQTTQSFRAFVNGRKLSQSNRNAFGFSRTAMTTDVMPAGAHWPRARGAHGGESLRDGYIDSSFPMLLEPTTA